MPQMCVQENRSAEDMHTLRPKLALQHPQLLLATLFFLHTSLGCHKLLMPHHCLDLSWICIFAFLPIDHPPPVYLWLP